MAKTMTTSQMMLNLVANNLSTEDLARIVESRGMVAIDRAELAGSYAEIREESERFGLHRNAAEKAINYLFEVLGEPGAGE